MLNNFDCLREHLQKNVNLETHHNRLFSNCSKFVNKKHLGLIPCLKDGTKKWLDMFAICYINIPPSFILIIHSIHKKL